MFGSDDSADIAVDKNSNLYITNQTQNQVLRVTPGGTLSIVAGNGQTGLPTPGPATASAFNDPHGIAVDSAGTIFVGDGQNRLVEKITANGTLSVIAGVGTFGAPTCRRSCPWRT